MKLRSVIATVPALLALAAPPASAALPDKDPLEAGKTTIQLTGPLADEIDDRDITVEAAGGSVVDGRRFVFPITGGKVLSGQAEGKIVHGGKIKLRGRDGTVKISRPRLTMGKRTKMTGRLGGKRKTLFELNLGKTTVNRFGFSTVYRSIQVSFSKDLASVFRNRLGVPVRARSKFGTANVTAIPLRVALEPTGSTTLTYSEQFTNARKKANVEVETLAPGEGTGDGPRLPIVGGYLFPTTLTGAIGHQGAVRLSKGGVVLELSDPTASIDDVPDLTFTAGAAPFTMATLITTKMTVVVDGLNVRLTGINARLTAGAAQTLNQTFGTKAFKANMLLGSLAVDADVR